MIEFKPKKLAIENFRGIPSFNLEINGQTPTYFIGPNNAGKSTLLSSIALVLNAGPFYKYTPSEYDFFINNQNEPTSNFTIQLDFASSDKLPSVHTVGPVHEVQSLQLKGNYYKSSGRRDHSFRLLDKNGSTITLPVETKMSGKDAAIYGEAGHGFKPRNARHQEISKFLPEVWLLGASNLEVSLYTWKTGPLNRLAKILSSKFFEENWEFSYGKKTREMPKGIEQAHSFLSSAVKDFPYWKNELKPALEKSLSQYLGRQTSIELNPLIQNIEEWLQQQLLLSFAAEMGGAYTPLDKMGDGFQSLVRLAALEVLAQMDETIGDNVFILYEEPETYLHPHLKRKLRNVFDRLAHKGWYVFCATHAPEFINFETSQSINRIVRKKDEVEHGVVLTEKIPENLKLQEKIDEYGNHEIFFSQFAIICEGKDDLFAIKKYLELSNVDLEAMSISILGCNGKNNIPDFAEISVKLKIPFCAVTDLDMDKYGNIDPSTNDVRDKISKIKTYSDLMVEWENTLEDCLNTPLKQNGDKRLKAAPEWQRSNVFCKSFDDIKVEHPKYASVCNQILAWINA